MFSVMIFAFTVDFMILPALAFKCKIGTFAKQ